MYLKNIKESHPDIVQLRRDFVEKFNKKPPAIDIGRMEETADYNLQGYKALLLQEFEKENAKLESKE